MPTFLYHLEYDDLVEINDAVQGHGTWQVFQGTYYGLGSGSVGLEREMNRKRRPMNRGARLAAGSRRIAVYLSVNDGKR